MIPLGGTARTRTAGRIATPAAAFAAETSAVRYARRSGPLEVHTKAPSGETSAHIAFGDVGRVERHEIAPAERDRVGDAERALAAGVAAVRRAGREALEREDQPPALGARPTSRSPMWLNPNAALTAGGIAFATRPDSRSERSVR